MITQAEKAGLKFLGRMIAEALYEDAIKTLSQNKLERHERAIENFKSHREGIALDSGSPVHAGSDNDNQNND